MQIENRYYCRTNHEKDPEQSQNVRRHDSPSKDQLICEFKFSVQQNVNFVSSNFDLLYREAVVSQNPGLLQPWVTD